MNLISIFKRFVNKFKVNEQTGCWEWTGCIVADGYGQFRVGDKRIKAHRLSYILFRNEIPAGMFVLHHCDNSTCVNPRHLFIGNHQDNMNDKVRKGRQSSNYGESNGASKLTEKQVILIKQDHRINRLIAKEYGVGKTIIGYIKSGKNWKYLNER